MADTGKQSPLGINVLGGILKNDCLQINKNAEFFMGVSKNNSYYYPYGKLVLGESGNNDSVLRLITWCINWGWHCGRGGAQSRLSNYTYNNQIQIGRNSIPALGNCPPTTWEVIDPQGVWAGITKGGSYGPTGDLAKSIQWANTNGFSGLPGPANAGYSEYSNLDTGQFASWYPYNTNNPNHGITQWGWVRCLALQAWNEFNWHGKDPLQDEPQYEDFCSSFMTADAFIQSENSVIFAGVNAEDYADGTFSNLTDLMSADIAGVTRATKAFGEELKRLGNIFDPRKLDRFGFPSTLLQTLYENGAIISDLNLALGASGLSANEINSISTGNADYVTTTQERAIYSAFLTIRGENLLTVLSACKVKGSLTSSNGLLINRIQGLADVGGDSFTGNSRFRFRTLADALDPQFLFPKTAPSLTVPIYNNTVNQATGSKFYHLIYDGTADSTNIMPVNSALSGTGIRNLIGTLFAEGTPPAFTSTGDRDADSYAFEGSGQGTYSAPRGFDSYLGGPNVTIPTKLGLAAGAFRYSMLQINNITNVPPNKIGACVSMLESVAPAESAELTTSPTGGQGARPINTNLQSEIPKKLGVGSGPDGSYTHSDFFGCMSGLPYAWNDIYNAIYSTGACQPASQSVLKKNYEQLYLGNTWEKASIELSVSPFFTNVQPSLRNPPNPDYDPRETIPNTDGDPEADPPIPPYDPDDPAAGGPEFISNPNFDDYKYLDAYADFARTHYAYTLRIDDLWYRTSVGPLVDDGGGYKRGGAPLPKVVIAPNNTGAEARITGVGTNNLDATPFSKVGGIHPDKFGRVTNYTTSNGRPYKYWIGEVTFPPSFESPPTDAMVNAKLRSGPTACPSESIEVEAPPTGTYEAYYRNGKNQGGDLWRTPVGGGKATIAIYGANPWPNPGNAFCQRYIDDANAEIVDIFLGDSGDNSQVPALNINWDITGRQLKVEQRARYLALNCVEVPRDPFVNSYETLSTFVDSMPTFATQTLPHMASPTIEMIVDLTCPGGISAVAMMREERNADRLSHCGIPLENTIPDSATEDRNTTLLYDGTVQGAPEGIPINGTTWTNPSWPYNPGISTPESPTPTDRYVSPYVFSGTSTPGTGITPIIIGIANPQVGPYTVTGPFYPGPITPTTPGGGGPGGGDFGGGGGGGGGTGEGTGPGGNIPIIEPTDPNFGIDGYGQGPGGPLNSVPTVNEAIEYIIHCNCDCWETITGT